MFLSLLVGMGVLLGSLPLYGMATDLIVRLVARLIRRGYTDLGFWTTVTVMMIVTLITAVCHLTEQGMGELRSRMPYADLSAFDQNRRLTVVPDLFTVGLVVR